MLDIEEYKMYNDYCTLKRFTLLMKELLTAKFKCADICGYGGIGSFVPSAARGR